MGQRLRSRPDEYVDMTNVAAEDKEGLLEELVCRTHVDMDVRLPERTQTDFKASVQRRWIDDLALVDVTCDPCSGMRGRRRAAQNDGLYLGVMALRQGRESVVLGEEKAELRSGDAVVWRSDEPASFRVHESQRKQTLIVPMDALSELNGGRSLFRSTRLDATAPATQFFLAYLDLLSNVSGHAGAVQFAYASRASDRHSRAVSSKRLR
jgi:hypothetical protein